MPNAPQETVSSSITTYLSLSTQTYSPSTLSHHNKNPIINVLKAIIRINPTQKHKAQHSPDIRPRNIGQRQRNSKRSRNHHHPIRRCRYSRKHPIITRRLGHPCSTTILQQERSFRYYSRPRPLPITASALHRESWDGTERRTLR